MTFVYEVLFPFARRWLRPFLRDKRGTPLLREITDGLRDEWMHEGSLRQSPPPWPDDPATQSIAVAAYVEWLMDRDRKSPALKLLQGHIWRRGYQSGELKSELFPDVAPAIRRWRASGVKVAIYSSGSVLAQRLLFGHTPDGDLTPELDGFFDTGVGPKTSSASYQHIGTALECAPAVLLFVSD